MTSFRDELCGAAPSRSRSRRKDQQKELSKTDSHASDLAETWKDSNDCKRAAASKSSYSSSSNGNDEIIHFEWEQGMIMNTKYKLAKLLGDGTFGRVVLARDTKNDREVAIKIIRDEKRYTKDAQYEAGILEEIRKADHDRTSGCVLMYETFMHAERFYCLVFEPLGVSLYDMLKDNCYRGFWMQDVQSFAKQCLQALVFLHGQLRVTHTDLKLENILIVSMEPPKKAEFARDAQWQALGYELPSDRCKAGPYMRPFSSQIKLIDFGNATHDWEHHATIISTRQYRGPEVLLELGWNESSDLWSMGCIFMELYVGELLFATHEEMEHLALLERIMGPLPQRMLEKAAKKRKNGCSVELDRETDMWRLPWPEQASSRKSEDHVSRQWPLKKQVLVHHALFADFCSTLLEHDPIKRANAINSLGHAFFRAEYVD